MQGGATPRTYEFTIAAGGRVRVHDWGRMFSIIDITGATEIHLAIEEDQPEAFKAGWSFELPQGDGYDRIELVNNNAAAVTVEVALAEGRVISNRELAALDSIDDRLAGEAAATQLADTAVAATGGAATLLFAANADRKRVVVQASELNGDYVYIGTDATVSDVDKMACLQALGSWMDEDYQGAVYAVGGVAGMIVNGYEV